MDWLIKNAGALALGMGLILLLALLTRGNLKGQKKSPVKGCDNCDQQQGCQHNCQEKQE